MKVVTLGVVLDGVESEVVEVDGSTKMGGRCQSCMAQELETNNLFMINTCVARGLQLTDTANRSAQTLSKQWSVIFQSASAIDSCLITLPMSLINF